MTLVTPSRFLQKKSYREVYDEKANLMLPLTSSRYIFLHFISKNTRNDGEKFKKSF